MFFFPLPDLKKKVGDFDKRENVVVFFSGDGGVVGSLLSLLDEAIDKHSDRGAHSNDDNARQNREGVEPVFPVSANRIGSRI
jgi:hypothetical protein